ncbi:MAG: 3-dehydroquinate synthase [Candidatus Omnitrophica bacterium]|nr:3-dehydroquinate synthase [Candidatus Omnitrophota bacterium]
MKSVRVSLREKSYEILVGRGILRDAASYLKKKNFERRHALIVTQKEVAVHHEGALRQSLSRHGFETRLFLTPNAKSSESAKSPAVYWRLIRDLAACDGEGKSVFLVALGGGVIGDLTGFAASVYRRGIPYVQVPTTLTAQVDSAIGGKTALDLPEGKNLLGTIYQPALVLCDTQLLSTLPDRHWSDGFAEVIKYGLIGDAALFAILEKHGKEGIRSDASLLEKVVCRSAAIKAKVVEKDEFDKKGVRIVLNLGHTAGHALEAATRFSNRYTHGEAIAIGMLVACQISRRLGCLKDTALPERLEKTLLKFELPLFYKGCSLESLLKAIGYDKKSVGGRNRFVLPVSMGRVTVVRDVPDEVIKEALEKRRG